MKKLIFIFLSLILLNEAQAFTGQCESISEEMLVDRFTEIKSQHQNMTVENILAEFQMGAEFIKQNIGEKSKQYEFALTVIEEIKTMTIEEIMLVEELRITIVPVMGSDQIYKEHKSLLLRDCRQNLLAALILT